MPNECSVCMKQTPINTEKREAILQATLELITTNGFHATPMSMVAERAGVAAGTIYHHFDSKETIINEIYARLKKRMGQALLENENPEAPYKERFEQYWMNLFHYFKNNPVEFIFLEQYANSPFISSVTKEENLRYYQPVIDFLAEGAWSGQLRNMETELLVGLVYGSIVSCVKLHISNELQMSDSRAQQAMRVMWEGIQNS